MKTLIYDIEVYPNNMCLTYCDVDTPDDIKIIDGVNAVSKIKLNRYRWIGFNIRRYDHPIIDAISKGASQEETFELSRSIIHDNEETYSFAENVVDLFEICPKLNKCSLKEFGHRMRYPILENLPYPFDSDLTANEWEHVKEYSKHDVKITYQLWLKLKSEQEVRDTLKSMYGIRLYGGAPKLAEKSILSRLGGCSIATSNTELVKPDNIVLSDELKSLYNEFMDHDYKTKTMPERLRKTYNYRGLKIDFGVGGLHAISSSGHYENCYDYDITSFYPSIILNCELGSKVFRDIYQDMYNKRIIWKKERDKRSEGLKLVLNSIFGKLGDKWADERVKAPHIMLNICLLGQFYLLDLIDKIEGGVLCANTDGIMTKKPIPDEVLREFGDRTGFKVEMKPIRHIILKDVNSYYIHYEDDSVKRKKEFLDQVWTHNVKAPIVSRSVVAAILYGIPIEETIACSYEPFEFCYFTKTSAKNGGRLFLDQDELADAKVRFWVAKTGSVLRRVTEKVDTRVIADYPVELVMDIGKSDMSNINRDFYVMRAKELYRTIMGGV